MSRIATEELRLIASEATPGPWQQGEMDTLAVHNWWYSPDDEINAGPGYGSSEANARLIALAPQLAAEVLQLREALQPFANFAGASSFERVPDNMPMTNGSQMAHRQVLAGDFKRARAALSPAPVMDAVKQGDAQ